MKYRFGLSAVLLLHACTLEADGPPQDCAVAKAEYWDCSDKFEDDQGRYTSLNVQAMWLACVPHSEPKVIEGSWGTDFEWNAFFPNARPSPEQAFELKEDLPPWLEFKDGVEAPASADDQARLWAIKFVGREETCDLFPDDPQTILVERILEKKLVWEVQGYPSYTFE